MKKRTGPIQTITRLAIGGLFLIVDELQNSVGDSVKRTDTPLSDLDQADSASGSQQVRDAMIGMVVDAGKQLEANYRRIDHYSSRVGRRMENALRPILKHRMMQPINNQFHRLVGIGERRWNYWVELGREETKESRELVKTAIKSGTNEVIVHLTENPEVRELVQSQSAGLANELVEELRERSVSTDIFLESFVRNLLRRPPRDPNLTPPEAVMERARPIRQLGGKVYRR